MRDDINENAEVSPGTGFKALKLDVAKYQAYLDSADLTEAEKRQFLETMWNLMVGFIDLGFSIEPEETCGQISEAASNLSDDGPELVKLPDEFVAVALGPSARGHRKEES